jgi:hypothetical protein
MRDSSIMQSGEWRKNAPIPKDYFDRKPEHFVNEGKPVEWSHLHENWYAEGGKSLVGLAMATPLDKDLKGDIRKAVRLVGGFQKSLKKTDKILIKPNMNSVHEWPGGGTDAAFLEALILNLKDEDMKTLASLTPGPWGPTAGWPRLGIEAVCTAPKPPSVTGKRRNG